MFQKQILRNQMAIMQALATLISQLIITPEFNRTGNIKTMRESQEYKVEKLLDKGYIQTEKLLSHEENQK